MVGPYPKCDRSGGISAVLSSYFIFDRFDGYDIHYVPTSCPRNKFLKMVALGSGLVKYGGRLLFTNPEIVHIHTASFPSFYRKMIYLLLALAFRRKTILHIHGGGFCEFYAAHPKLLRMLISRILSAVDIIIVLSESWLNYLQTITKNSSIRILHNPIDTSEFASRTRKGNKQTKNVIYMAGLEPEKGICDLLEAVPQVLKAEPTARFVLCGDGDINKLKSICKDKGILDHVEFCGWVSGHNKIAKLIEADVFVLPSHCEGLPVSIIEAMSAGLPVVSTCVGGIPDIVEHGVNGFLVQVGDTESLADRLIELLATGLLRERMSELNVKKAKDSFDVSVVVNKLCDIYHDLCLK